MKNQGTSEKREKVKVKYRKYRTERLNGKESESDDKIIRGQTLVKKI